MASPTTDRRLGLVGNTAFKAPALLATTGNIVLSGEQVIDGTLTASSRVLVKNQTDSTQNGLYDTGTAAWTRCIDANGNQDLARGTLVLVSDGTANAGLVYQLVATTPITVGTTAQTWQLSLTASVSTLSFTQGVAGAATRSALSKMRDVVSLADFTGADPTGATDSSAALIAALAAASAVDMRGGTWKISASVTIPGGRLLDIRGATINLNTGATPGFQVLNGSARVYILGGGGLVNGTASAFLFCQGTTNQPTLQAHYASEVHLEGVSVSSATITAALQLDKAAKTITVHACDFFTPNGILDSGAGVEVTCTDSIIYGATGVAGTRGVQLRSTGGTTFYNQGWSFVNCTIDNFEICHDVADVFVYQLTGGYHGVAAALAATTGYALQAQAPLNTNLTEVITVGGGAVIAGRVRFAASAAGQAYNAKIDALFTGVPGTAIAIENNAANIDIVGIFKAGTGTAVGVVGTNNNANITAAGKFDSTYTNGVVLNGATGTNCVVGPLSGPTSGDIFGAGRSNIQLRGVPIHSSGVAGFKQASSAANLGGAATYAVAVAISTQAATFARGETGVILICLSFSGANAATQNVQLGVPAGMVLMSGTGYSAANLYLGVATGLLFVAVPYYCTADGSGNVTVTNQAGNTLTINNQGYCALRKDT